MKQYLKFPLVALLGVMLGTSFTACSEDDEPEGIGNNGADNTEVVAANKAIITSYVNNVVVKTYSNLADASISLHEACVALKNNPSQAGVQAACDLWIEARKYWELSEAFLYGAAADYAIDPHIDSWPLDKAQLDLTLKNSTLIDNMREHGCNFDGFGTLGSGLLGFHAVEYMLFRDGGARNIEGGIDKDGVAFAALSETELVYCAAVAEDLRNQCIRLEAAWAGVEGVTEEKQNILAETELEPSLNYGAMMISAGKQGNYKYRTQISALTEILEGAATIADEVGNTKITDPVASGNVLDVESWYSWNSIADFADNIRSVKAAYYGHTGEEVLEASVSTYLAKLNPTLDAEIKAAIDDAIREIEAMPAPFRDHLTEAESAKAKAACNVLFAKLEEAIEAIN